MVKSKSNRNSPEVALNAAQSAPTTAASSNNNHNNNEEAKSVVVDDISLLQQPIQMSGEGFLQTKRAYENGTDEIRQLLLHECELIYECKVCRNMFRSLPNFISHKRMYCSGSSGSSGVGCGSGIGIGIGSSSSNVQQQPHQYQSNGYSARSTNIVEPTSSNGVAIRSRSTGSSPVPVPPRPPSKGSIRDISSVVERLRKAREQHVPSTATKLELDDNTVLQLESMPTTTQAVYQTIKHTNGTDSMRDEVDEVRRFLEKTTQSVLGPDGKLITPHLTGTGCITCEFCPCKFQTDKMLQVHMTKMHNELAFVFQCPSCPDTYMQAANLIRHLSADHKKPVRRIRKMRDTIFKRRIQQCEIQPRVATSRELKRLQLNDASTSNAEDSFNFDAEPHKVTSSCTFCKRSFERRAALSTHLVSCPVKLEAAKKSLSAAISKSSKTKLKRLKKEAKLVAKNNKHVKQEAEAKEEDNIMIEQQEAEVEDVEEEEEEEECKLIKEVENIPPSDAPASVESNSILGKYLSNSNVPTNPDNRENGETPALLPDNEASLPFSEDFELDKNVSTPTGSRSTTPSIKLPTGRKPRVPTPPDKLVCCRCKICQKEFEALGNVRRHIAMLHHLSERYGCSLCPYRAFRQYDILNHLVTFHRKQRNEGDALKELVNKHACEFTKNDIEDAIELINNNNESTPPESVEIVEISDEAISPPQPVPKKRKGRHKKRVREPSPSVEKTKNEEPVAAPANAKAVVPEETANIAIIENFEKRPKRIRVKAVDKDFVYDMPSFSKKDTSPTAQTIVTALESLPRPLKRRLQSVSEQRLTPAVNTKISSYQTQPQAPQANSVATGIVGSARRMMLQAVQAGCAMSAIRPDPSVIRTKPWSRIEYASIRKTVDVPPTTTRITERRESFVEHLARRTASQHHQHTKHKKTIDASLLEFTSQDLSASMKSLHVSTDENDKSSSSHTAQREPLTSSNLLSAAFLAPEPILNHVIQTIIPEEHVSLGTAS